MRKTEFIEQLRHAVCVTADAALAEAGQTAKGCPYIEKWLAFYKTKDSQHLERALVKYVPEAARARIAKEYIPMVCNRVHRAATTWAKTGKITGVPEELASQLPGQGFLGAVGGFFSGLAGAALGFLGGTSKGGSEASGVLRKARDGGSASAQDTAAVKAQLGAGHSLDSRIQSQMSTAFGHDFSGVRVHTDSRAATLSSDLSARAFTVGGDIAFGAGEYQPGTPIGDALIAHELAHVVQQGGGHHPTAPMEKGPNDSSRLEEDADFSAIGVVASIWAGTKKGLADIGNNALPRLRSGLKLQRCAPKAPQVKAPAGPTGAACAPLTNEAWSAAVAQAGTDTDAMAALIRQALCPMGIEVVVAGQTNPRQADPADYRPIGTSTINFDPDLNKKDSHPDLTGPRCNKDPVPKACETKLLDQNYGYNFRDGSTLYAILGPKAIDRGTPAFTQRAADHELYLAKEHTAKRGKDRESSADAETDTWTRDFIRYFHLLGYKARGPHGEDRYFGDAWNKLIGYYDTPEATPQVRQKSLQALLAYYQNPPTSTPGEGKRGHPTTPKEVKQLFELWLSLREAEDPSSLLVRDLKGGMSGH